MAYTHHDRLSALDNTFLELESPSIHMHVGAVGILEPGPLAHEDGGLDIDRVLEVVEAGLHRVPRFRQRLERTPLTGRPVWVDDPHFNLLYHVRHTALPVPGDERRLKRLAGRILSQKLDPTRPMWELWMVEGLEKGRFAVISKVHHCLIDGISGVDLLAAFMGVDPEHRLERVDSRWLPRPAPGPVGLLADDLVSRVAGPARGAREGAQALARPAPALREVGHRAAGVAEALSHTLTPASPTPLNVPIGPHRRFDWLRFAMSDVHAVRERLGGTVNDVVLSCVAGALRPFLAHRGVDVDRLDFRVFVPVSTRTREQRGKLGNRVSMLVAHLPVDEADPRARHGRVMEETQHLKGSGQAEGNAAIEALSDWTWTSLITGISRLAARRRAYNLVVTNVPGPPVPAYLDGARLVESYPLVPLFENQALGIALFSYDGGLFWGLNADWDLLPDLHDLATGLERSFEALCQA